MLFGHRQTQIYWPGYDVKCFNVVMRCEAAASVGIYIYRKGGWNHSRERIQTLFEAIYPRFLKYIAPFVMKKIQI